MYCQLEPFSAHVMLDTLCRVALIGRPAVVRTVGASVAPTKRMILAVFAASTGMHSMCNDYSLRVYCIDDNEAAVQAVVDDESRMGATPLCDMRNFAFIMGGDLCVSVEDVSRNWRAKIGAEYQVSCTGDAQVQQLCYPL
jgi:hypothetical protein